MKAVSDQGKETVGHVIRPGATIGMVGGGQLGKMFANAASAMGYRVVVFCESEVEPAAQVATFCVTGRLDDAAKVDEFASLCDVITYEFENIPAETIERCRRQAPTYPDHGVLAIAQDREIEKTTFQNASLPVTPFRPVESKSQIAEFASEHGWPVIVKTSRSGYDGKGQSRIDDQTALDRWDADFSVRHVAEKMIELDGEVSVVVARSPSGETSCFPVFENHHRHHVLEWTRLPALVPETMQRRAREIAIRAADTLDLVGLLCVEFFISGDDVLINEVAPRPHNSGHLTIEACHTSQFTQHVRAVCNLPLGDPSMRVGSASMVNLLGRPSSNGPEVGQEEPGQDANFQDANIQDGWSWMDRSRASLHWYGKGQEKPGRKMGHLTRTGEKGEDCVTPLLACRDEFESSGTAGCDTTVRKEA